MALFGPTVFNCIHQSVSVMFSMYVRSEAWLTCEEFITAPLNGLKLCD